MNIFSAAQMKAWDAATMRVQGISSWQLMERAATACTDWLAQQYGVDTPFLLLCGSGNNGGDGLAITRMLLQRGYAAKALLLAGDAALSADCAKNKKILEDGYAEACIVPAAGSLLSELPADIVLVDALFGYGLSRPLEGWMKRFVATVNKLPNKVIAIDLPSGVLPDAPLPEGAVAMDADVTLTFQSRKRGLLHPEGGTHAGAVVVLNICLDETFGAATGTPYQTIDDALIRQLYRPRLPFSHKGTLGMALIVGGSYGMVGAAVLAARASGRAGAGKVRGLVPECGYAILQSCAPEAMCITSGARNLEAIAEHTESAAGIGVGPGMGRDEKTVAAFRGFLEQAKQPVVLDADALNILGDHQDWLQHLPAGTILTPHPKEFERMFGKTEDSFARIEKGREAATKHNIHLVMKDRYTVIINPEGRCWYNLRGNAGLATGGSGDVLCGIITGLLAQAYEPFAAAVLGVHLHALAGDLAAAELGQEAMVAGDLVEFLGKAFLELAR